MPLPNQNFLTDYSGIAAAGSAAGAFGQAFGDAQDRQMKRQEMTAKIAAQQSQMQREADQTAIAAKVQGLQKNAQTGQFDEAPLSPREQQANKLKVFAEGGRYKVGPDGQPTGDIETDPNSPKAIAARNSGIRGQAAWGNYEKGLDSQSAAAVKLIHGDKVLVPMRQQATNVDKGRDLLSDKDHPPNMTTMNEISQDFVKALTGNGVASDFKLKEISTPSIQGKIQQLKSYLTANPDQPAPPDVVKFWSDMGDRLKGAYDRQMGARASNLLVGQKTAYKHNTNAYAAMSEAANLYKNGAWRNEPGLDGYVDQPPQQQPTQQQAPPAQSQGSLVPPQRSQGILSSLLGPFMGSNSQATTQQPAPTGPQQAAPPVPKEGETKEYGGKTYKVVKGHWVAQ